VLLNLALSLLLLTSQQKGAPPPPQQDLSDLIRHFTKREPPPETGDVRGMSIFPTVGATPAGGVAFGVLVSTQRRYGSESLLSTLHFSASYSTKQRLQIAARVDQQMKGKWRLVGDWRFYDFTERTYGLGSDRPADPSLDVPISWGRVHATMYRKIFGGLAAGAGYHYDARKTHEIADDPLQVANRLTTSSGPSIDATFDSRDNQINASRGFMARASASWFPEALGSTRAWQAAQFEIRTYRTLPFARRQVLAFWGMSWLTTSGAPGYFDLPSTGWDLYGRTARGYAAGRYRGRDWLYGELEYRVDIMRSGLIGAVVFANSSSFSDAHGSYGPWVSAAGFGFRIKLDKRYGSNLAIDHGWGANGSRGFFLSLNEAF
jgi:outer membrane protein assembly factor BamA